jgi:hypothetical protein
MWKILPATEGHDTPKYGMRFGKNTVYQKKRYFPRDKYLTSIRYKIVYTTSDYSIETSKHYIFLLDASGSMAGARWDSLIQAATPRASNK